MSERFMLGRSGDDIPQSFASPSSWRSVMKVMVIGAALFLGVLAGPANAKSIWDQISDTAPRSGVFDDLNLTAPKSVFETLNDTAPRSDGVFGELEKSAP
jgi:hypothetical protein